jgi:enoyl-CoA hydratase/carnithine racemase
VVVNFESLDYAVTGSTAFIRLNRPEAKNAFTTALYAEVPDAVRLSERGTKVRCVVVTGAGGAFACMGGDCMTIPSRDIVIAAESARFGIPEVHVGLADAYLPTFLFGQVSLPTFLFGQVSLPTFLFGQVSLPTLKYLTYTGKLIDAWKAERIGLVTEVVPDDELDDRVNEVVAELAATSDADKAQYKAMFNRMVPAETSMRDVYPLMFIDEVGKPALLRQPEQRPMTALAAGPAPCAPPAAVGHDG